MQTDALASMVQSLVPVLLLRADIGMNPLYISLALAVVASLGGGRALATAAWAWLKKEPRQVTATTFVHKRDTDVYTSVLFWLNKNVPTNDVHDTTSVTAAFHYVLHKFCDISMGRNGSAHVQGADASMALMNVWNGERGDLTAMFEEGSHKLTFTMRADVYHDTAKDEAANKLPRVHGGILISTMSSPDVLSRFTAKAYEEYVVYKCSLIEDTDVVYTIDKPFRNIARQMNGYADNDEDGSGALSMPRRMHSTKSFENVILDDDTLRRIRTPLDEFIGESAVARYKRMGWPRKLGFLLYGPPGTGKTSLVFAICKHVKKALLIVSSTDVPALIALAPTIANKVILLDDVDCFNDIGRMNTDNDDAPTAEDNKEDDDGEKKAANKKNSHFSNLLAALDGNNTFHECILVMTSNRPLVLDPTLVRPGRIDHRVEVRATTPTAIRKMVAAAFGDDKDILDGIADARLRTDIDMATIANCIVRTHIHDPKRVVEMLTTTPEATTTATTTN